MVVPLYRVNFWDDLGQFNSAVVALYIILSEIHL